LILAQFCTPGNTREPKIKFTFCMRLAKCIHEEV
jgi:hypothetical protein